MAGGIVYCHRNLSLRAAGGLLAMPHEKLYDRAYYTHASVMLVSYWSLYHHHRSLTGTYDIFRPPHLPYGERIKCQQRQMRGA